MSQEKEDSMSYLEMALRAAKEMDELANCPRYDRTTVATKATSATKASKPEPETSRKLRDLVDALEQCGVVVKISGVGSPSGGKP
jgi:hypothetical protein